MSDLMGVVHGGALVCWFVTGCLWVYTGWRRQPDGDFAIGALWFAVVSVGVSAWMPR